jgi:hypothetical protein
MPEIVTGFRPPEKPNNLLINKDHSGIPPAILPTKIREEPKKRRKTANTSIIGT